MKNLFVLGLLFFILACNKNETSTYSELDTHFYRDKINIIKQLRGEKVNLGMVLAPVQLFFYDSLLFISSVGLDYNLSVYDSKNNHEKIANLFSNGAAPEELFSSYSMYFEDDSTLWVYDIVLSQAKKFNIKSYNDSLLINFLKLKNFALPVVEIAFLNSDKIVTTTQDINPLNRFYLFDTNTDSIQHAAEYPNYIEELPKTAVTEVYSAKLISSISQDRILLAYEYTDLIEIYDGQLNLLKRVQGPDNFPPIFKLKDRGGAQVMQRLYNKTRLAYQGIETDGKFLYLLYGGGKTVSPDDGEDAIHHNQIVVMNWDGEFIELLYLDHAVTSVAIDGKNKIIYGLDRITSEVYSFPME